MSIMFNEICIIFYVDDLHTGFSKSQFNKQLLGIIDF